MDEKINHSSAELGGGSGWREGARGAAPAMTSPGCSGHDITRLHVLLTLVRSVDAGTCRGGELRSLGAPRPGSVLCV